MSASVNHVDQSNTCSSLDLSATFCKFCKFKPLLDSCESVLINFVSMLSICRSATLYDCRITCVHFGWGGVEALLCSSYLILHDPPTRYFHGSVLFQLRECSCQGLEPRSYITVGLYVEICEALLFWFSVAVWKDCANNGLLTQVMLSSSIENAWQTISLIMSACNICNNCTVLPFANQICTNTFHLIIEKPISFAFARLAHLLTLRIRASDCGCAAPWCESLFMLGLSEVLWAKMECLGTSSNAISSAQLTCYDAAMVLLLPAWLLCKLVCGEMASHIETNARHRNWPIQTSHIQSYNVTLIWNHMCFALWWLLCVSMFYSRLVLLVVQALHVQA